MYNATRKRIAHSMVWFSPVKEVANATSNFRNTYIQNFKWKLKQI